ncbi:hypothetical protein MTR_0023s0370 [Medicago truncatula]|uniref:Uncharacterized protein n=1 Tax=Medicago truncatula TaxID=3880 RepID=A0A072TJH0_MEDTR|nr:hypothetical protein MTR_0023s0370 [Medicago truncatula]
MSMHHSRVVVKESGSFTSEIIGSVMDRLLACIEVGRYTSALERLVVQSGGTRCSKRCLAVRTHVLKKNALTIRLAVRASTLNMNLKMAGRNDAALAAALEAVAQAVQQQPQAGAGNGEVRMLETFLRNHPPAFKGRYDCNTSLSQHKNFII